MVTTDGAMTETCLTLAISKAGWHEQSGGISFTDETNSDWFRQHITKPVYRALSSMASLVPPYRESDLESLVPSHAVVECGAEIGEELQSSSRAAVRRPVLT